MNCPRCGRCENPKNRIIIDTCGHRKCRKCFIDDEQECQDCIQTSLPVPIITISNEKTVSHPAPSAISGKRKLNKELPKHITEILNDAGQRIHFKCANCSRQFRIRTQIYYHYSCKNDDNKKYKCKHCEKCFASSSHLKYHLESHSTQTYNCKICDKTFSKNAILKKHQKLHETIPKSCDKCGKLYRCPIALAAHIEQHENPEFKIYNCIHCDKSYTLKSSLQQHMLKHDGKTFDCTQCGQKFQRNSNLKIHLHKHAMQGLTNPVSYSCETCFLSFKDQSALKRHTKINHSDGHNYRCIQCDITIIRKDNFLRHVRNMHHGETVQNLMEIQPKPDKIVTEILQDQVMALPKTVKNSSVIKCIGNVEPVQIPTAIEMPVTIETNTIKPLEEQSNKSEKNISVSTAENVTPKKFKKKYDPIEMYRKILISDDENDNEDETQNMLTNDVVNQDKIVLDNNNQSKEPENIIKRSTALNTSNFSEMHWRKNFKYTYEFQEY